MESTSRICSTELMSVDFTLANALSINSEIWIKFIFFYKNASTATSFEAFK